MGKVASRALVKMMLEYDDLMERVAELEEAIADTVMQTGETQQVGRVCATYYNGRKSYQYQGFAEKVLAHAEETGEIEDRTEVINAFTEVKTKVDWRAMLKDLGYRQDEIPFTQSEPRVKIKLEKRG